MKKIVTLSAIIGFSLAAHVSLAQDGKNHTRNWQQARIERLMKQFDTNQDGQITRNEVLSQRQAFFQQADSNNDGWLSFEEFKNTPIKKKQQPFSRFDQQNVRQSKSSPRRRFARLDKNKDRQISQKEFIQKQWLLKKFDCNQDGIINREELQKSCGGRNRNRRNRW